MQKNYPRWLYHKELPAVICRDEAHELELGSSWKESPADCIEVEVVPESAPKVSETTAVIPEPEVEVIPEHIPVLEAAPIEEAEPAVSETKKSKHKKG